MEDSESSFEDGRTLGMVPRCQTAVSDAALFEKASSLPRNLGTLERRKISVHPDSTTLSRRSHARQQSAASLLTEADRLVEEGIVLHEALELERSTKCFLRAAELNSVVGMYMYGIAVREGWGVKRDAFRGFEFLMRAVHEAHGVASTAISESIRPDALVTTLPSGVTEQLAVSLYELAQCYRNGWGTRQNKRTAAHYLKLAAELLDSGALVDLANCYLRGDGAPKDKSLGVACFRLASLLGTELPCNSWIWKTKYDACGISKTTECVPVFPDSLEVRLDLLKVLNVK